ncbi:MAG: hypothetical protein L6V91_00295 [Bacilli bacterium]|nr:MAG: hypothetical protein L6V91_00295 [Bacilli bacterium]
MDAKEFIFFDDEIVLNNSVKYEKEKLDLLTLETGLYNEYSYHASKDIIFQAYIYEGELVLNDNELQTMFAGTNSNYEMLLMEYPWKSNKKIEFNNERQNCFITNNTYDFFQVNMIIRLLNLKNYSIEQPSLFLIEKLGLTQSKDGYWYNSKGRIVCYDKKIETGQTKICNKKRCF